MRVRLWFHAVLVTGASCTVLLPAPSAFGYHTNEERSTDGTAYTLGGNVWSLGIKTFEYGLFKRLDLSTYPLPWFFRIANVGSKVEYRFSDALSIGTGLHLFRLDVQKLKPNAPPLVIFAVPWQLSSSYRFSDTYTLSLQTVYTYIRAAGTYEEKSLDGAAAVSNLQVVSTLEARVSMVTALLVRLRYLAHQRQPSASAKYVVHPDDFTTVTIAGAGRVNALDVKNAWSIVPGVALSWNRFNLRVGVGYGNLNIVGVNFVMPKKTVVPELDLFWRW